MKILRIITLDYFLKTSFKCPKEQPTLILVSHDGLNTVSTLAKQSTNTEILAIKMVKL